MVLLLIALKIYYILDPKLPPLTYPSPVPFADPSSEDTEQMKVERKRHKEDLGPKSRVMSKFQS